MKKKKRSEEEDEHIKKELENGVDVDDNRYVKNFIVVDDIVLYLN